jgi:hypothetical protein
VGHMVATSAGGTAMNEDLGELMGQLVLRLFLMQRTTAPVDVIHRMLDRMSVESDSPVYDELVAERGAP